LFRIRSTRANQIPDINRGWDYRILLASIIAFSSIKAGSVVRPSFSINGNRPLKTGLLRHLAKLAEIPDEELN
jgi:hypothetical protein